MMLITGKSKLGLRGLLTACALVLGLASCSTMSEKECQFANWRDIGLTDGLAGKSLGLLNERRSDCAEANIQLDQKAYLKGREEGLKTYCQLGNAVHLGLRGEPYEGVCPAAIEPEFRRRYTIGRDVYHFRTEIDRLERRLASLEQQSRAQQLDFEKRLGSKNRNEDYQRLYRKFQNEQDRIRYEQAETVRDLHWNEEQLHNAETVMRKLR